MRNIGLILILTISGYVLTGCTATSTPATNGSNVAANANANANANTAAKPAAAVPTAESLIKYDIDATEAYFKGDSKYFETFLSDKYVHAGQAGPDKARVLAEIAKVKCDVTSTSFTEPKAFKVGVDLFGVANWIRTLESIPPWWDSSTQPVESRSVRVIRIRARRSSCSGKEAPWAARCQPCAEECPVALTSRTSKSSATRLRMIDAAARPAVSIEESTP